ncbi:hypothetical protein PVL29_011062 [Vitis rotundifolia]|uniref:Uncharacterized protein n=1 Tax=Vitis rotundifolia TaxID=103349 RepID=A0AA39DTU6_VITRO|nr:hypothetical protein PVL29_011062 [Vitis rotundifolia]
MFELKDRLSKLEAALSSKKDSGNEELLKMISDLQSKLQHAEAEQISEREKAQKDIQKLTVENAKLHYRVTHLVRALKEADCKLEAK